MHRLSSFSQVLGGLLRGLGVINANAPRVLTGSCLSGNTSLARDRVQPYPNRLARGRTLLRDIELSDTLVHYGKIAFGIYGALEIVQMTPPLVSNHVVTASTRRVEMEYHRKKYWRSKTEKCSISESEFLLREVEYFASFTGIESKDILHFSNRGKLFEPAFALYIDHTRRELVLVIRGTASLGDGLTDASIDPVLYDPNPLPFEELVPRCKRVSIGDLPIRPDAPTHAGKPYSSKRKAMRKLLQPVTDDMIRRDAVHWYGHKGMYAAGMHVFLMCCHAIRSAMDRYSQYSFSITGHSLGACVSMAVAWLCLKNSTVAEDRMSVYAFCAAPFASLGVMHDLERVSITHVAFQSDIVSRLGVKNFCYLLYRMALRKEMAKRGLFKKPSVHGKGSGARDPSHLNTKPTPMAHTASGPSTIQVLHTHPTDMHEEPQMGTKLSVCFTEHEPSSIPKATANSSDPPASSDATSIKDVVQTMKHPAFPPSTETPQTHFHPAITSANIQQTPDQPRRKPRSQASRQGSQRMSSLWREHISSLSREELCRLYASPTTDYQFNVPRYDLWIPGRQLMLAFNPDNDFIDWKAYTIAKHSEGRPAVVLFECTQCDLIEPIASKEILTQHLTAYQALVLYQKSLSNIFPEIK